MKQGTILHGKVKVLHNGNSFVVTSLPEKETTEGYSEVIQSHFWRGFWHALLAVPETDTADFHFAIALAYYQRAVTPA